MNDQLTETSQARIEAMEAKIAELEARLRAQAPEADEEGKELIENIRSGAGRLYDELSPFVEKYKEEREAAMRAVCTKISEHPLISVAAAFGAGLVIAKLLDNKVCLGGRYPRS